MSTLSEMSDGAWFLIFMSVAAICVACGVIFTNKNHKEDPLTEQITAISRTYSFDSNVKTKLISELISKYNPTNTMSKIELK